MNISAFLRSNLSSLIPQAWKTHLLIRSWNRDDPVNWPAPSHRDMLGLERYEFKVFSQHGEDGLLRKLFLEIGFHTKTFLEFGFGPTENNSLRLVLKEGFGGTFIDGQKASVDLFNHAARTLGMKRVKALNAFLHLDNLEAVVAGAGLPLDIDLLSIDVDGNDYWFWEKLSCVSPRMVVIEYNASLGDRLSWSTPYDPQFDRLHKHASGLYCGASLSALEKLGRHKGYRLVACESHGVNAVFVRDDCMTPNIPPLSVTEAFRPHRSRLQRGMSPEAQFDIIKDLPFVEIR